MLACVKSCAIAILGLLFISVPSARSQSCVIMPGGVEVCEGVPDSPPDLIHEFLSDNGFAGFGTSLERGGVEVKIWNDISYTDVWVRSPHTTDLEYYKNYLIRHAAVDSAAITDFYIFSTPHHFNGNYFRSPREFMPRIYGNELSTHVRGFMAVCSNNVRAYAEQVAREVGRSFSSAGRRPTAGYMSQLYVGPGWRIDSSGVNLEIWGSILNTGQQISGNQIEINEYIFDDGTRTVFQQNTMCLPTLWVRKND